MSKARIFVIIAATLVLTGAGCGKSASQYVSERATEKIIEQQTGGKVDLKTDDNTVKYETKEGTFESGDNVKLPEDFPKDVYVTEGKIVSAISNKNNGVYSLTVQSEEKAVDLARKYEDKIKSDGWKITGTMNFGDTYSVIGEKGERQFTAMIGKSDDKTTVVISVGNK